MQYGWLSLCTMCAPLDRFPFMGIQPIELSTWELEAADPVRRTGLHRVSPLVCPGNGSWFHADCISSAWFGLVRQTRHLHRRSGLLLDGHGSQSAQERYSSVLLPEMNNPTMGATVLKEGQYTLDVIGVPLEAVAITGLLRSTTVSCPILENCNDELSPSSRSLNIQGVSSWCLVAGRSLSHNAFHLSGKMTHIVWYDEGWLRGNTVRQVRKLKHEYGLVRIGIPLKQKSCPLPVTNGFWASCS